MLNKTNSERVLMIGFKKERWNGGAYYTLYIYIYIYTVQMGENKINTLDMLHGV